jgi:hypothetical protein
VAREARIVYDVSLVQKLCREISSENDRQKLEELLSLLQAVIKDDQEEIRVRLAFLARKFANALSESKAAD